MPYLQPLLLLALFSPLASAVVISDFEAPDDLQRWRADEGVKLELVSAHATAGKQALSVSFRAGSRGVWMEPVKPSDWLSKDRLSIDVYNANRESTLLVIRVTDVEGKALEKKEELFAIVATRVETVLNQQHWFDLSRVKRLWVGVENLRSPAQIFIDNIRVASTRPELVIPSKGGIIQAEDFTRGRCMVNPSGWGERRNDTPIIQSAAGGPPWAEWDFQIMEAGRYQIDVKHAALDPRPCRALMDGRVLDVRALSETTGSWEGVTAKWFTIARIYLQTGKHTFRIDRSSAIPHIDAIHIMPTKAPMLYPFIESQITELLKVLQRLKAGIREIPQTRQNKAILARQKELQALEENVRSLRTTALSLDSLNREIAGLRGRLSEAKRDTCRTVAAVQMNVPEAKVHYAVTVESSLVKVFPELDKLSAMPSSRVEISLAANEYESAQIIVVPIHGALRNVRVSASDLKCKSSGALISPANIRLHRVGFVDADSGVGTSRPGMRWPDPLLPNAPFDVPPDEARPVWITVFAPKGTKAGIYEGTITVAPRGERPAKLTLAVKVYGFELDDETHVKTTFFLPIRWGQMSREEVLRWMDYVIPYRIGIMDIGWGWGATMASRIKKNADGSYDFSRIGADLEYVFGKEMSSVSLGDTPFSMADKTEAEKREMVRCLRAYAKYIKSRGWWDRCYYKLPDEPGDNKERLAKVKAVADLVKEADPDYRRLCTVRVREDMFGYVDIWCPLLSWHNDEVYNKARARGGEIWMYTCCGPTPPYANIAFIDQEAIAHRILMWTCWRFNYGGYLYWGIKFWPGENFDKGGRPLWPEKPWHSRIGGLPAGDGYLSYPDKDGGPLPCIRIELYRDGVEDYEYHYLLKKALGGGKDAEAEKLLNLTYEDDVCPDGLHYTRSPEALLKRREALAAAIERLQ